MARRGLLPLALILLLISCYPVRSSWEPPESSASSARPPEGHPTLEELKATGPTYVVYDDGPTISRSEQLTALLEEHLRPVIEERDLPLGTAALFWVLVTREGEVADARLHTTSTVEAFDEAAAEVARALVYEPARRGGAPVPVWVLRRIHLLMP